MAGGSRERRDPGAGISRTAAVFGGIFLVVMTALLTWGLATGAYGVRPGGLGTLRSLERQPGFANLVRALTLVNSQYVDKPNMQSVYAGAVSGALRALRDPYSAYFSPQAYADLNSNATGRYSGIGVQVEADTQGVPVVVQVFPGSPAAETRPTGAPAGTPAGLRAGDRLVSVDGAPVKGLPLTEVAARILGRAGTSVSVVVDRAGAGGAQEQLTFTLLRREVTIVTVSPRMLPDRIGYLAVSGFNTNTPLEVGAALAALKHAGMTALVLDLRYNPGGVLEAAVATGQFFLPPGTVTYLQGRQGRQSFLLRQTQRIAVPMVVLVNRYTASAAEVLAGAIQDDRVAPLVGERTFGKGIVQRVYPLQGGAGIRLTVAHYYTPRGRDLNGKGLEPNLVIPGPSSASAFGNPTEDPQLAAAIAILKASRQRAAG